MRASDYVKSIMKNFDQEYHARRESSKHKRRQDSDIFTAVDIVKEVKACNEVPGRTHPNISSIPKGPISVLNFTDLNMWLTKQKKSWINLYEVVPCYCDC